jgi:hypothetical protein
LNCSSPPAADWQSIAESIRSIGLQMTGWGQKQT